MRSLASRSTRSLSPRRRREFNIQFVFLQPHPSLPCTAYIYPMFPVFGRSCAGYRPPLNPHINPSYYFYDAVSIVCFCIAVVSHFLSSIPSYTPMFHTTVNLWQILTKLLSHSSRNGHVRRQA